MYRGKGKGSSVTVLNYNCYWPEIIVTLDCWTLIFYIDDIKNIPPNSPWMTLIRFVLRYGSVNVGSIKRRTRQISLLSFVSRWSCQLKCSLSNSLHLHLLMSQLPKWNSNISYLSLLVRSHGNFSGSFGRTAPFCYSSCYLPCGSYVVLLLFHWFIVMMCLHLTN